jgi:hypothetical protein
MGSRSCLSNFSPILQHARTVISLSFNAIKLGLHSLPLILFLVLIAVFFGDDVVMFQWILNDFNLKFAVGAGA